VKPRFPEHRLPVDFDDAECDASQSDSATEDVTEDSTDRDWDRALEDPEAIAALYSPEYLRQCSGPAERLERIAELKRRIEARAYAIDADRIAEELLLRGDLSD
jgi:anti-sigma28 factor (negative regulator of flagellin synthesis)